MPTGFLDDPSIDVVDRPRGLLTALIRLVSRLVKARTTHGAIMCVVNQRDEVLLVRQRLRERNRWGLPSGFVERHEAPADTAVRELREETGFELGSRTPQVAAEYFQPWAQHYDHLFLARVEGGRLPRRRSLEISDVRWFSLHEAPPPLTASSREAFRRARTVLAHGDATHGDGASDDAASGGHAG